MAQTGPEQIVVGVVNKYGCRVGDKQYNFSKKFADQAKVVEGATLGVEIYTADSGAKYINKVNVVVTPAPVGAPPPTQASQTPPPASSTTGSAEYKAKQLHEAKGKTRCNLYAAAVQSPFVSQNATTKEEFIALAKEIAEAGVEYSFKEDK